VDVLAGDELQWCAAGTAVDPCGVVVLKGHG
jgi:hypothetical protein